MAACGAGQQGSKNMANQMGNATATAAFAAMLNEQESTYRKGFDPGERVNARVLTVNGNYAILDVQAKNEGLLPVE